MSNTKDLSRSIKISRRMARIWSILVFAYTLLRIITPDPNVVGPVPALDWFLLSLWGIAVSALLIAWRWELIGGSITILTMLLREILWVLLRGDWMVEFLIIWAFVVPPAILFLIAWNLEKKTKGA